MRLGLAAAIRYSGCCRALAGARTFETTKLAIFGASLWESVGDHKAISKVSSKTALRPSLSSSKLKLTLTSHQYSAHDRWVGLSVDRSGELGVS